MPDKPTEVQTRPETGGMRFGDDWRGIFIRGDNAFYYWTILTAVIDTKDPGFSPLEGLRDLLYQAVQNQLPHAPPITPDENVQHMKAFTEAVQSPVETQQVEITARDLEQLIGFYLSDADGILELRTAYEKLGELKTLIHYGLLYESSPAQALYGGTTGHRITDKGKAVIDGSLRIMVKT
jgi:hypothetical protein